MATVPKNGYLQPLKTDVTQNHIKEKIIASWIKKLFLDNIFERESSYVNFPYKNKNYPKKLSTDV